MSEIGDSTIHDLMKQIILISKNINTLTELIKTIGEKYTNLKAITKTIRRRWLKCLKRKD